MKVSSYERIIMVFLKTTVKLIDTEIFQELYVVLLLAQNKFKTFVSRPKYGMLHCESWDAIC